MPDVFDAEKRSQIMAHVRNKNTAPEIKLRSLLHKNGFRFRVNREDLPGKPDVVLVKYKTVIFVNGCFWHGHDCKRGQRPQSNMEFWYKKIDKKIERDKHDTEKLHALGWRVLTVWECELKKKDQQELLIRIKDFFLERDNAQNNTRG